MSAVAGKEILIDVQVLGQPIQISHFENCLAKLFKGNLSKYTHPCFENILHLDETQKGTITSSCLFFVVVVVLFLSSLEITKCVLYQPLSGQHGMFLAHVFLSEGTTLKSSNLYHLNQLTSTSTIKSQSTTGDDRWLHRLGCLLHMTSDIIWTLRASHLTCLLLSVLTTVCIIGLIKSQVLFFPS